MKTRYMLVLILFTTLLIFNGCSKDDSNPTEQPPVINEAELLVQYLEANGDYLNTANPAMMSAQDVREYRLTKPNQIYIMDIRSASDFSNKGHIEGAINVTLKDIVTHIKSINSAAYERVVITCYSGQTSGMATAILRVLGYSNVYSMRLGMSAWASVFATDFWSKNIGNNYTNLVTTVTAKGAAGNLPTLSTGKTTGKEILDERIAVVLSSANPFGDITVNWSTLTGNLSNYYIVNYWPEAQYNLGHLPGAIQYTPKNLKLATDLKTLPTNKTIALYCYTGQTSAQVCTILKILGYDARSLTYGTNGIAYDWMTSNSIPGQFVTSEIKEFPYVTGQ